MFFRVQHGRRRARFHHLLYGADFQGEILAEGAIGQKQKALGLAGAEAGGFNANSVVASGETGGGEITRGIDLGFGFDPSALIGDGDRGGGDDGA